MGRVADRFDAIVVRVTSPDGRIEGILENRDDITLSFTYEDAYYDYHSETAIAAQLSSTLNALLAGREHAFHTVIDNQTSFALVTEPHWDLEVRRYREERDEAVAESESNRSFIFIESQALRYASVSVESNALEELSDGAFLAEVHSAIGRLWVDWAMVMKIIHEKHYGVSSTRHRDT